MSEQENSLANIIVNRVIMGVIAGMMLFLAVPMAIAGVDSIFAALDGQPFSLWTGGVVILAVILVILGVGMLWLAVKPPYRVSK